MYPLTRWNGVSTWPRVLRCAQHDWFYTRYISVKRVSRPRLASDRYSSILRIVAESDWFDLPFNQFFQSHVFGFMLGSRGYQELESWFNQKCWPVSLLFFFFVDVSFGWVWFNLTHLFLTHLWCYQAVVSLVSLECDEGGNGKYLFLKILCIIYTFNSFLFLLFRISRSKF